MHLAGIMHGKIGGIAGTAGAISTPFVSVAAGVTPTPGIVVLRFLNAVSSLSSLKSRKSSTVARSSWASLLC